MCKKQIIPIKIIAYWIRLVNLFQNRNAVNLLLISDPNQKYSKLVQVTSE